MTTEPLPRERLAETAPRRRRVPRWLWLAGPLAVAAFFGWQWLGSGRAVDTDNAYVRAERVLVSSQVAGRVIDVAVGQNAQVRQGDLLFRLDPEPLQLALDEAEARLAQVEAHAGASRAGVREGEADLRAAQSTLEWSRRERDRVQALLGRGLVARTAVDEARHAFAEAQAAVDAARAAREKAQAELGGRSDAALAALPDYRAALAQMERARLDLEHAQVRAPADGTVGQHDLQVGEYLAVGQAAMPLVASGPIWIEANFKETDLGAMRVGQQATIRVDSYPEHEWQARVASISPASGAEFSVLPAQNASGNWVKIVQRIPVRLELLAAPADAPVLRAGMSAEVEVDLRSAAPADARTAARG